MHQFCGHIEFHNLNGQAAVISANFVDKLQIPLISWTCCSDYFLEIPDSPASTAAKVHFFHGIP